MFIPNSRIVSRLADCHLSGYNDETFENLLKEQQSGNSYSEPLKDDKKRRMQECLNDLIEDDNDILDTNKSDRRNETFNNNYDNDEDYNDGIERLSLKSRFKQALDKQKNRIQNLKMNDEDDTLKMDKLHRKQYNKKHDNNDNNNFRDINRRIKQYNDMYADDDEQYDNMYNNHQYDSDDYEQYDNEGITQQYNNKSNNGYDFDENEQFVNTPIRSMRQGPRQTIHNKNNRILPKRSARIINNSISPYNEHNEYNEMYDDGLYLEPYEENEYKIINKNYKNNYKNGGLYINDDRICNYSDRFYNKTTFIGLIIVCIFIIVFMFIFSLFYCSNNRMSVKISTLENIISESKNNKNMQPIYIQPSRQEDNGNKYNYDEKIISPVNSVPFSGNNQLL